MIKLMKTSIAAFFMTIFFLGSCNLKDKFNQHQTTNSEEITASIIGVVKDELGQSIPFVTVIIGANTVTTDANGIYILNKISCTNKSTTVRFTKQGYFNGYKTIAVQANEKHIANVTLMKKENPQILNTQTGGTVSSGNGIEITFPANALVNKTTGTAYNGQANVYIKRIDPTTEIGQKTMPGNLTGLNTSSQEMLLQSFGMLAAEIEDNNGNLLQIASGKEATFSSEIPTSLLAQAKSTIPLWYFDETKMQWIEEGSATLNGTKYEGNVKHFSFWNCDQPNASINLEFTLKDQNGNPLSGYYVTLKNNSNNSVAGGTTNSAGWIGGLVYPNASLTMEIFENNICGNAPIYTQTLNTSSNNQNLGNITINIINSSCVINGTVVNCNNIPSSNSSIFIYELGIFITPNSFGQFSYSMPCTPTFPLTFLTYDLNTNANSITTSTINNGNNNLGILISCNNQTIFMDFDVKNLNTNQTQSYNFLAPTQPVVIAYDSNWVQNNFVIYAGDTSYSPNSTGMLFGTINNTLGTFSAKGDNGFKFSSATFSDLEYTLDTINSTVTYTNIMPYPGTVEGSINLKLSGYPSGNIYTAIGTFRAIRGN